jgi:type III pantothenate kinase
MKLVLDIGNTLIKAGVFDQKQLTKSYHSEKLTVDFIKAIARRYVIDAVILSSVKHVSLKVNEYLHKNFKHIELSESTPVNIINKYKTPATLGKDRLAGVVGASSVYKSENILIIDAGTCITYDFINKKTEYLGGSISPGIQMRFKALHTFTGKLPLVSMTNFNHITGTTTEESILAGVINGAVGELDAIINNYKEKYSSIKVVICGGDAPFLASRLKNTIFALPELILIGLNEILDYNVQ